MRKRRVQIGATQLSFFDVPEPAPETSDLAGFDRTVAVAVAEALKGDVRTRTQIAAAMSDRLGDTVSALMLDAYASPARATHNISAGRLLALIAVTERVDILDRLCRHIGMAVLTGTEIKTARLGHLKAQRLLLDQEIRTLRAEVQPIDRGVRV